MNTYELDDHEGSPTEGSHPFILYRKGTVMSAKVEITTEQRQAYLELLEQIVTEEEYSAYGVHVVLNQVLVANGADKVRPQMMYNYLRNGLLVRGEKIFGETLRKVTKVEVMEFILRYSLRNGHEIKVGEPTNKDQLALFEMDDAS